MQHVLANKLRTRMVLHKGVHQALDDFRWLADDVTGRPTRIAELVPLAPSAEGHHDAAGSAGTGAGGVWFPSDTLQPWKGWKAGVRAVWRYQWPKCITSRLVCDSNPNGTITNSDHELVGLSIMKQII